MLIQWLRVNAWKSLSMPYDRHKYGKQLLTCGRPLTVAHDMQNYSFFVTFSIFQYDVVYMY